MTKLRYRTRLKHFYFKTKKNILNYKLTIQTSRKFYLIKQKKLLLPASLTDFYTQHKIRIIESQSTQSIEQKKYLESLSEHFQEVLEIGFNGGHSAEIFLKCNPLSNVTSIDLGYWYYCKFGNEYLSQLYPNRLNVIFRDSIQALESNKFIKKDKKFNLIYIDGNHTYHYAYNDLLNCKKFADSDTILIMDDIVLDEKYRSNSNKGPTEAWLNLVSQKEIIEIEYQKFSEFNRGLAIGKYSF